MVLEPSHAASALTADESSLKALEKSHRRLDTDDDLLETFLENEGKILRLPADNNQIDISDLAMVI